MRAYIVLFITLLYTALNGQTGLVTQVHANVNLAAPPFDAINTSTDITISGSSGTDCMLAYGFVSPIGEMKQISYSNMCGLVNVPHTATSWDINFKLIGNKNLSLPLKFNFIFDGTVDLKSTGVSNCLSTAYGSASLRLYSIGGINNSDNYYYTKIFYKDGQLYDFKNEGFNLTDAYAIVSPKITFKANPPYYISIPTEILADFLSLYNNLSTDKKTLPEEIVSLLSGNSPLAALEINSAKLSLAEAELIDLMNTLGTFIKMGISSNIIDLGLEYDITYKYNLKTSVSLETNDEGTVHALLQSESKATVCEGSSANQDFSNTFKLSSITIPKTFQHSDLKIEDVKVKYGNIELPVQYDTLTTKVKEEIQVIDFNIFPNPTVNYLQIETSNIENGPYELEVINKLGQQIYYQNFDKPDVILDLTNFSPGIYFLRLKSSKKIHQGKFIKL